MYTGVTTGFITVGVFGSLPIIALRAVDYYLNIEPFSQVLHFVLMSFWLVYIG
jgi:hypothetical protein